MIGRTSSTAGNRSTWRWSKRLNALVLEQRNPGRPRETKRARDVPLRGSQADRSVFGNRLLALTDRLQSAVDPSLARRQASTILPRQTFFFLFAHVLKLGADSGWR